MMEGERPERIPDDEVMDEIERDYKESLAALDKVEEAIEDAGLFSHQKEELKRRLRAILEKIG